MKSLVGLGVMLYCIYAASAVTHSWKAFYTGSTGLSEFPEFVAVNIVDEEPVGYFDSRTSRFEYRQKWMEENLGLEYLDGQTNVLKGNMANFKGNVKIAMERFNQSGGVHTWQKMYGCEWDDETGTTDGFRQYGYDGEDFLNYDMKTLRFIAPVQQAFVTAQKWNIDAGGLEYYKNYITQECIDWLKKYVSYGRSTLERRDHPEVSVFQKDSSSPVVCHATGFFPRGIMVTWQRDGEEVQEDVEQGEMLPNGDGTFQITSRLTVKPEDWKSHTYTCTVQHKSLREDIVKTCDFNPNGCGPPMGIIIGCVVGVLIVSITVIGVRVWKKSSAGYGKTSSSDTSSETNHSKCPIESGHYDSSTESRRSNCRTESSCSSSSTDSNDSGSSTDSFDSLSRLIKK